MSPTHLVRTSIAGLVLVVSGACFAVAPAYAMHLSVMLGIYAILAYSLNLVVGFAGLLSFTHAAFFGVGAYLYALLRIGARPHLTFTAAWSFPLAALCAVLLTALFAGLIGSLALRFRGDYFIFATIALQIVVFALLYNTTPITNGPYGLAAIPGIELSPLLPRTAGYAVLAGIFNVLALSFLFFLYRSPFGLALKALREDEVAAASLKIAPLRQYVAAFVISGGLAALAGVLYASYVSFVDPTTFSLRESIFLVTILLLGGSGNRLGPASGVLLMILLPEALRFLGLPDSVAAPTREIIYGGLLVILMYWRPRGLAGEFSVR